MHSKQNRLPWQWTLTFQSTSGDTKREKQIIEVQRPGRSRAVLGLWQPPCRGTAAPWRKIPSKFLMVGLVQGLALLRFGFKM